jgi:UDP-N-acetylmuramate dehydrogenase
MNARCYGRSVSDVLSETAILDETAGESSVPFDPGPSATSGPLPGRDALILFGRFRLEPRRRRSPRRRGGPPRRPEAKGHYRLPPPDRRFKNNYSYGKPTGQVVDELGLRGLRVAAPGWRPGTATSS